MNCEDYRIAIHDHARGILSAERAAEVELHHRDCQNCIEFNTICAELPCRDFVQFLGEYVEDRLSTERRAIFERHMTVCPDCTAYLDSYRRTIELGAESARDEERREEQLPEELVRAILHAISTRPD